MSGYRTRLACPSRHRDSGAGQRTEPAMLDHVSITVTDLARAVAFYDAVMAALGQPKVWGDADGAGYGLRGGAFGASLWSGASSSPFSTRSMSFPGGSSRWSRSAGRVRWRFTSISAPKTASSITV